MLKVPTSQYVKRLATEFFKMVDNASHVYPSFMRLVSDFEPVTKPAPSPIRTLGSGETGLKLRAMSADYFHSMRIQPEIGLDVHHLGHDGIEAHADRPLIPGGRVSLMFPESPFLPRPGTFARVERCDPRENGYRIQLSYEAQSVA